MLLSIPDSYTFMHEEIVIIIYYIRRNALQAVKISNDVLNLFVPKNSVVRSKGITTITRYVSATKMPPYEAYSKGGHRQTPRLL
jgi:hypothetical protein